MATSKQIEARARTGRRQASKMDASGRPKRKRATRAEMIERHERERRLKKYWAERYARWEEEMRDITRKTLPNFAPTRLA